MMFFLCISFIIMFAVYSQDCLLAAGQAASQFLYVVLPSIFPFYVASEILSRTGFIETLGNRARQIMQPLFNINGQGAFAMVLGMVSGYPAGARLTASLYENSQISKIEAERLSSFTNNCGPLFIIGAIGAGMLNSWKIGLFLWICHLLASITTGIIFSNYKRVETVKKMSEKKSILPIKRKFTISEKGRIVSESIIVAINIMIPIAGFIIFFSVVSSVLTQCGAIPTISALLGKLFMHQSVPDVSSGMLSGLLEITGGISQLAKSQIISQNIKLPAISFIAGWAGVSVHIQVIGILSNAKMSCRPYIKGKILHGCISAIYTLAVGYLFNINSLL